MIRMPNFTSIHRPCNLTWYLDDVSPIFPALLAPMESLCCFATLSFSFPDNVCSSRALGRAQKWKLFTLPGRLGERIKINWDAFDRSSF